MLFTSTRFHTVTSNDLKRQLKWHSLNLASGEILGWRRSWADFHHHAHDSESFSEPREASPYFYNLLFFLNLANPITLQLTGYDFKINCNLFYFHLNLFVVP